MTATSRILLVDGDLDNRAVYRAILRHRGYEVMEAADGEAALATARSKKPDILVTELALPKLSGLDLLTELRADEATHDIRVIVLTAITFAAERKQAEAAGCQLYLCKPVEPLALANAIGDILAG
jgi:CheY-like chemotaxis protein